MAVVDADSTIEAIGDEFPKLTPFEGDSIPHLIALLDKIASQQGEIRPVTASFIAEAAGNYADDDVISDHATNGTGTALEFQNAVLRSGGGGKVVGANLSFIAATAIAATSELQLFSQVPTATELDDNAASGGVGAADTPYYLGMIAFAAGTDVGASTFCLPATLTPAAPLMIRAGVTSIFGRLIFRDAETNETASMVVQITLYIE